MKKIYRELNSEVLYSKEDVTTVDQSNIQNFKKLSSYSSRNRIRLCTHLDQTDSLHEMLIVHEKSAYVRPHKHLSKSESTHIIEGLVDVVLFDEDGRIQRVIRMGDYASGKIFYYRMATSTYHTLIIRSDVLVFHETTNGPFNRDSTVMAPWAPEDGNLSCVLEFMSALDKQASLF